MTVQGDSNLIIEGLDTDAAPIPTEATMSGDALLLAASYLVMWSVLLVPTIRSMARGWRPLGDDAAIGIGAWRALTLHPPLLGTATAITGGKITSVSDPGPLEFWLLGPFVHLYPGQGLLLGSALLCAGVLSLSVHLLWRACGPWAAAVFSLVVADLAITSPTPFLDPVWNSSFGFLWFIALLAIAFVVGMGNLRYTALLLFVGSVSIDSHLQYLPSVGLVLVASAVCGWMLQRPPKLRWLWWTIGVAFVCWVGPLYQQLFERNPNVSLLVSSSGRSDDEGWVFGLKALSRAASFTPIWSSPPAHRSVCLVR
jgi:hypothetical protein